MIKRLLFLLASLSSMAFANCPKYSYSDPHLDDEINQICHDEKYPKEIFAQISSMTATYMNVSAGNFTSIKTSAMEAVGMRATGVSVGASGASLELLYSGGGLVQAYNRSTSVDTPLTLNGSTVILGNSTGGTFISATNTGVAVKGTTTNDNASSGNVGETVESVVSATNFPTSGNYGDMTSIVLTAGDWDVKLVSASDRNTATQVQFTDARIGISLTTGNSSTGLTFGSNLLETNEGATGITDTSMAIAGYRMTFTTATNVYAKMQATYSGGQPQIWGRLTARRVR